MCFRTSFRAPIVLLFILLGTTVSAQTLRINEILTSNRDGYSDGFGEFDDWVEIYNPTDDTIDMGGMFLTDDLDVPTKYLIPKRTDNWTSAEPKNFVLFWFDGDPEQGVRHLDISLKSSKGLVALYDRDTTLIDVLKFKLQNTDVSIGRSQEDPTQILLYEKPSPNELNVGGLILVPDSVMVAFDKPAGFYKDQVVLELSTNVNSPIYYTIDGADPSRKSTLYTGPITINKNTVVRSAVIPEGNFKRNRISTGTYFINEKSTLSVVSITADPYDLWDEDDGMYIDYESRSEESQGHMEYFDRTETGEFIPAINKTVDLTISGNTSRRQPKKSFNIIANTLDGDKKMKYKVFDDKDIKKFGGLQVRADATSGLNIDDLWVGERFKNELIYEINSQMKGNVAMQAYEPVLLFLNGEFWGLYNLMERKGRDFIEANFGVKDMDILTQQDPEPVRGSGDEYHDMITYLQTNDVTSPEVYAKVCDLIDVDSYVDQWVYEIYAGAHDININIRCWRGYEEGSKWKWISYDKDSWNDVEENAFAYYAERKEIPLYEQVIKNPTFRNKLLNRICDYLNTGMSTENVLSLLDKITARIDVEVDRDRERWQDTMLYMKKGEQVAWMKDYAKRRPDALREQMKEYFGFYGKSMNVTVEVPEVGGTVKLNSLVHEKTWSGIYLETLPVIVEAIPAEGYRFVKWKSRKLPKKPIVEVSPGKCSKFIPIFKKIE